MCENDLDDLVFPTMIDPFVAKIMSFTECPLPLSVSSSVEYLHNENGFLAIKQLKTASSEFGFMLPKRRTKLLCSTVLESLPHVLTNEENNFVAIPFPDVVCALELSLTNPLFSPIFHYILK